MVLMNQGWMDSSCAGLGRRYMHGEQLQRGLRFCFSSGRCYFATHPEYFRGVREIKAKDNTQSGSRLLSFTTWDVCSLIFPLSLSVHLYMVCPASVHPGHRPLSTLDHPTNHHARVIGSQHVKT